MTHAVNRLVPMVFAADVDASIEFYSLLGFAVADRISMNGRTNWVWLAAGAGNLMLSRADAQIDPDQQAILLYLYTDDLESLRDDLLSKGVENAGRFPAKSPPNGGKRVLYEITTPFYMPEGELRVSDPDGHCLLIGQADPPHARR